MTIIGLAAVLAGLGFVHPALGHQSTRPAFTHQELEPLLQALQDEGLPRPFLNRIFYDARLRKIERVVRLNGVNPDSADRYEQFYGGYAIKKAKRFKRRHFSTLVRVEAEFGIPANIIVAILLVETQFGTHPLPFRVLEVLTTLVVEANHDAIARHYKRVKLAYPEIGRVYFTGRVNEKAEWAYGELVALLTMRRHEPASLFALKGSYAGAFGMPQFLPSSYLRWAVDGNQDGSVDLDHTTDAIASIANYLREHGWTDGTPLEEKMRAIWAYNNSTHYVDAIFEISRRMMVPSKKAPRPTIALPTSAPKRMD